MTDLFGAIIQSVTWLDTTSTGEYPGSAVKVVSNLPAERVPVDNYYFGAVLAWLAQSPTNQIAPYVAPPAAPRTCTMNEWNIQMDSTTQLTGWLALRSNTTIKAKDAAYLACGGDDNRYCETNERFKRLVGKLINSTDTTAIAAFIKTAFDAIYAARAAA